MKRKLLKVADFVAVYVLIMIIVAAGDHLNAWIDSSRAQKAGVMPYVMTTDEYFDNLKYQYYHIVDIFEDELR